jgi:hypothetical protein
MAIFAGSFCRLIHFADAQRTGTVASSVIATAESGSAENAS